MARKNKITRRILCPKYPVTEACRNYLLEEFPALVSDKYAEAYRGLAGYFLFGTFYDKNSEMLVGDARTINQHLGVSGRRCSRDASYWIHVFGNDVWEVVITREYDRSRGLARELSAKPGREVLWQIAAHNLQPREDKLQIADTMVDLVTGHPYSERNVKRFDVEMRSQIMVPDSHPEKDFADYLNTQPQTTFKSLIHANWNRTVDYYHAMPASTAAENKRKAYAFATLSRLRPIQRQYYTGKPRTRRLYAISPSINELPRELRKEILYGCVSLDARSVQLAIVSQIWNMPTTRTFLENGGSIWQDVQTYMGIGLEWKPFIKEALYSVLFGRSESDLRYFLETGRQPALRGSYLDGDDEIYSLETPDRVDRFLTHPIIAECVSAQRRRLTEITQAGRIVEASGFERAIDLANGVDAKSLLGAEVQSYEIALMSGLLPTLERYGDDVRVMSFLHDGMALWFTDKARRPGVVNQLKRTFLQNAQVWGFPTQLEEE